jgi:hypothetical protein
MEDEVRMIRRGPLSFLRITRYNQFEPGEWEVVCTPEPGMPKIYVIREPRHPMLCYAIEWLGVRPLPHRFTISAEGALLGPHPQPYHAPILNGC